MTYNQTTLKKMKKDELVKLVLDIQKNEATTAVLASPTEEQLKEENERLKKHIIHNYQDLHPEGDGIPYTEFFPGGDYAVEDDGHRTPYSVLCGQTGEGIYDLQGKVDDLEHELKHFWNENDKLKEEIKELKEWSLSCATDAAGEIDKLKKQITELEDRNDELEDYYCEEMEKLKEELDAVKEREVHEWDFLERSESVGEYYAFVKEHDPAFYQKVWGDEEEKEEEEGDSCCMGCDKRFCMYDAQKCEPEAYEKYFGSGEDDGDLCPTCLVK